MKRLFLCFILSGLYAIGSAQVADSSVLYKKIKTLDSLVFEVGFNNCNINIYDSVISEDLEFYHDVGGPSFGREAFKTSTKNNICGSTQKIKRKLVSGTMKVFPLYQQGVLYGAIEEGEHEFYILQNKKWQKTGWARFSILWTLKETSWKMTRTFSYDHKAVN